MRALFSILGFALLTIVGCNSMVPVTERVIELPTRSYQRNDDNHDLRLSVSEQKRVVRAIRDACRGKGRFSIVNDHQREAYICYPEDQ
jgi:hypothetical protein